MPIRRLLEETASRQPDRVAVTAGEASVTYGQLAGDAARLAAGLAGCGLVPGDRIAVLLPNSIALVTTVLAAFAAGCIVTPLSLDAAPPLNAALLAATGARGLVTTGTLLAGVPAASRARLAALVLTEGQAPGSVGYDALAATPPAPAPAASSLDPLGLLVFTSGTTGRPKGTAHTQGRLAVRADAFVRTMGLTGQDTALTVFPAARPISLVGQILAMLRVGGATALAERPGPDAFWEVYGRTRPTYCLLMPSYARRIFQAPGAARADHSRLRFWISAGDHPGPELPRQVQAVTGRRLCNMYGMSEIGMVSVQSPTGPDKPGSLGRPLPGVAMRLVDRDGREARPGEAGRLFVRTPDMMVGYWNDTLATHQAMGTGWLDTCDLVRVDADGDGWFLGRASEAIVRNAVNVASALVAEALAAHPAVAEAMVVGMADPCEGQVPVAFYRPRDAVERPAGEAFRQWVAARVDAESVPVAFHALDQWPLTPQGKVDKKELARLAATAREAGAAWAGFPSGG